MSLLQGARRMAVYVVAVIVRIFWRLPEFRRKPQNRREIT
jgi:hypothetical protein